jgi:predicted small metal-binding protein
MKQFRCGDLIPGCAAAFTGTTDDILAAVGTHARDAHGLAEVSPELVAQVRDAMTPVG